MGVEKYGGAKIYKSSDYDKAAFEIISNIWSGASIYMTANIDKVEQKAEDLENSVNTSGTHE